MTMGLSSYGAVQLATAIVHAHNNGPQHSRGTHTPVSGGIACAVLPPALDSAR